MKEMWFVDSGWNHGRINRSMRRIRIHRVGCEKPVKAGGENRLLEEKPNSPIASP